MSAGDGERTADQVRFTDILTTAAAVADYLGASVVGAAEVLAAIAVLTDERTMAELGRATSPLVPRQRGGPVDDRIREVVQRWFARLGHDGSATLDAEQLQAFRGEINTIAASLPSLD